MEWIQTHVNGFLVSNTGKVKGPKGILKTQVSTRGYEKCTISKDGKRQYFLVHRLVAQAFLPNTNNKPEVNHLDGDKLNNHVSNLEWVTRSENELHRARVLGKGLGTLNGNSKFNPEDIIETRILHMSGMDCAAISRIKGISKSQTHRIINGKHWSHL